VLRLASIPPDGEGSQPRIRSLWLSIAKRIRERGGTSFYFTKDTFDAVAISAATDTKSEAESIERSREMRRGIDEEGRVVDLLLVAEFVQKQHGQLRGSRRKQPHMEEIVRFRIDGRVEPMTFVVDLNHGLVNRHPIRCSVAGRLEIGFFDPVVDRSSAPSDT
jgi:hypothetical protein